MYIRNSNVQKMKLLYQKDIRKLEKALEDDLTDFMQEISVEMGKETELYVKQVDSAILELCEIVKDNYSLKESLEELNRIFDTTIHYRLDEGIEVHQGIASRIKEHHREILDNVSEIAVRYYNITGEIFFKTEYKMSVIKLMNKYNDAIRLVITEEQDKMGVAIDNFREIYKHKLLDVLRGYDFEGIGVIDTEERLLEVIREAPSNKSICLSVRSDSSEDLICEPREKAKMENIYDFKVLNRLAEENGYVKVRQKGDHGIFKDEEGKIAVIPQGRPVGKGLSCKIQKSITG